MTGKKNVSLPCAVGSTSYIDTVKNSYYVDKTLLIRDLIDDHAAVTLFTRPRRFGKTLAVDMLKVFFEKTDQDTAASVVVSVISDISATFAISDSHKRVLRREDSSYWVSILSAVVP